MSYKFGDKNFFKYRYVMECEKKIPLKEIFVRRTGRSTADILSILGKCMNSPEEEIFFKDHYCREYSNPSIHIVTQTFNALMDAVNNLGLLGFNFHPRTNRILFSLKHDKGISTPHVFSDLDEL